MNSRSILPMKHDICEIKAIIRVVADKWNVESQILLGRSRRQPVAFARQLCMALAYQKTHMSLNQVGECFDNRDHATVLHALKQVDKASSDPEVAPIIREVIKEIDAR